MTSPRSLPAILSLAQALNAWALELCAWLAAHVPCGPMGRALRRWTRRELAQAETHATGLVVLAALQMLAPPPERAPKVKPGGKRPRSAPGGFAWRMRGDAGMRAMRRRLFPHARDLARRARRLCDCLGALLEKARALAPRLAHCPPLCALVAVSPPADPVRARAEAHAPAIFNSS